MHIPRIDEAVFAIEGLDAGGMGDVRHLAMFFAQPFRGPNAGTSQ